MSKAIFIYLVVTIFTLSCSLVQAERIYCRGGRVIQGKILLRDRTSVYFLPAGAEDSLKVASLNIEEIERMENNDGSISKYDYVSLYKQARVSIERKDYQEAVRLYNLLLESFPENNHIRYLRAIFNHQLGKFKEAAEDYKVLIARQVADATILNNLGTIYAQRKEIERAMHYFTRAVEEEPGKPEAHNNLARLLLERKNYPLAIEEYRQVIQLEPDNIEALYNLGFAYMQVGNLSAAREQWERVLAIRPEDKEAKRALQGIKAGNSQAEE